MSAADVPDLRYSTLTASEAAALARRCVNTIRRAACAGILPGVQVDGWWLFDRDDVLAYAARMAHRGGRPEPRVDAGPLLRHIELRGGDYELGMRLDSAEKRALERARHDGTLTVWMADHLAVKLLGLTPVELWGEEYLSA